MNKVLSQITDEEKVGNLLLETITIYILAKIHTTDA
jgi:hypothetical protein